MCKVKCNNCGNTFDEESLSLFEMDGAAKGDKEVVTAEDNGLTIERFHPKPDLPFYFKGCPNCKTDGYLMDLYDGKFLWKDKSGRDFTNTLTADELVNAFDSEENYHGETMSDWLSEEPEVGDRWENAANEVTRIS